MTTKTEFTVTLSEEYEALAHQLDEARETAGFWHTAALRWKDRARIFKRQRDDAQNLIDSLTPSLKLYHESVATLEHHNRELAQRVRNLEIALRFHEENGGCG